MKLYLSFFIAFLFHILLLINSEPLTPIRPGGVNAELISNKISISSFMSLEPTITHVVENKSVNQNTQFAGQKQKLSKIINTYDNPIVSQTNNEQNQKSVKETINHKQTNTKQQEKDFLKQPEKKRFAQNSQQLSSTKVKGKNNAVNTEVIILDTLPTFKYPRPGLKYPLKAKRRRQQGVTILSIELNEKGEITFVKIIKSSGHKSLDIAAVNNVKQWQFNPVKASGHGVKAKFTVPIEFNLT